MGNPFRMQHDSSTGADGAEVISNILTSWDEAGHLFSALQIAAVDSDAEPGLQAGFHVHVNVERMSIADKEDIFWNFMRWEDTLAVLAGGPHGYVRNFNRTVRNELAAVAEEVEFVPYHPFPLRPDELWYFMVQFDRHVTLNPTPSRTMEFRLWNATRSAWRMELFCRLSQILCNLDFIRTLDNVEAMRPGTWYCDSNDAPNFVAAVEMFDPRAGELAARQLDYFKSGSFTTTFAA